jgi:hypothetical protein
MPPALRETRSTRLAQRRPDLAVQAHSQIRVEIGIDEHAASGSGR